METTLYFIRNFVQLAIICTLIVLGLRQIVPVLRPGPFWRQVGALWAVLVVLAGTAWVLAAVALGGAVWLGWWLRTPERRLAIHQTLRTWQLRRQGRLARRQPSGAVIIEMPRPISRQAPQLPAPDPTLRLALSRRRREDKVR